MASEIEFQYPSLKGLRIGAVTAVVMMMAACKPLPKEFVEACDAVYTKIHRTVDNVDGYFIYRVGAREVPVPHPSTYNSQNVGEFKWGGCSGGCARNLIDLGYQFHETGVGKRYLDRVYKEKGLVRYSLKPMDHPACDYFKKGQNYEFSGWQMERKLRLAVPDKRAIYLKETNQCIAVEEIGKIEARYVYRFVYSHKRLPSPSILFSDKPASLSQKRTEVLDLKTDEILAEATRASLQYTGGFPPVPISKTCGDVSPFSVKDILKPSGEGVDLSQFPSKGVN